MVLVELFMICSEKSSYDGCADAVQLQLVLVHIDVRRIWGSVQPDWVVGCELCEQLLVNEFGWVAVL